MHIIRCLHIIVSVFFIVADSENYKTDIKELMNTSTEHKILIKKVLSYYNNNIDSQKYEAACYIVRNIQHHKSVHPDGRIMKDIEVISPAYIINNIEFAFNVWRESPWHNEIGFDTFCNYILPYRVGDEPISCWRKKMYAYYCDKIKNVKNPLKAFSIIYHDAMDRFDNRDDDENGDVMSLHYSKKGGCNQRTIYVVSVLRSLGIPAAYDYTGFWGNYSTKGHSWVSYVNNNKTYTLFRKEKTPKEHNRINDENFNNDGELIHDFHKWDSIKRVSAIYRKEFIVQTMHDKYIPSQLYNLNARNVMYQYGYTGKVIYDNKSNNANAYLCAFHGGYGWKTVIEGKKRQNKHLFENLPYRVVYLPVIFLENHRQDLDVPFYIDSKGRINRFVKSNKTENVIIKRKYPLRKGWYDRWKTFIGSTLEVSEDSSFSKCDTLHIFNNVLETIVNKKILIAKKYRYIRINTPRKDETDNKKVIPLAEFRITLSGEKESPVKYLYYGVSEESLKSLNDNNYSTRIREVQNGYWVGYYLGERDKDNIYELELCLQNDMNMIRLGHEYELFYYDKKWISLGIKKAESDSLVYNNVPAGVLLWIKNHTEGSEERIFTYENKKQVWW